MSKTKQRRSTYYGKIALLCFLLVSLSIGCGDEGKPRRTLNHGVISPEDKEVIGEIVTRKGKKIEAYFDQKFRARLFNGTVLFAEEGKVIFNKAYGYANRRNKDSLSTTSSFQIASASKPITALAILILLEAGKLSLDDEMEKFFPGFPYPGITVKMLLCHRSGLPNYMYFSDEFWSDKNMPITNDDVLNLIYERQPPRYNYPNRRYNYSNTNYMMLASIIEKITGKPFEDFMFEQIFQPLRMDDTEIYRKSAFGENKHRVLGYEPNGQPAEDFYQNGVVGDKGVYTSVEDLFKLDQALYGEKLLSGSTLDQAFTACHKELGADDNYGLGWRIRDYPDGLKIVYHAGWWKGFRSYFIRIPKEKQTIIVLSNTSGGGLFKVDELRSLFN